MVFYLLSIFYPKMKLHKEVKKILKNKRKENKKFQQNTKPVVYY